MTLLAKAPTCCIRGPLTYFSASEVLITGFIIPVSRKPLYSFVVGWAFAHEDRARLLGIGDFSIVLFCIVELVLQVKSLVVTPTDFLSLGLKRILAPALHSNQLEDLSCLQVRGTHRELVPVASGNTSSLLGDAHTVHDH